MNDLPVRFLALVILFVGVAASLAHSAYKQIKSLAKQVKSLSRNRWVTAAIVILSFAAIVVLIVLSAYCLRYNGEPAICVW